MKKKAKNLKPKVFFNASVILVGLKSPRGGSGKLLAWAKEGKIQAVISEIIVDEVGRHLEKLAIKRKKFLKTLIYFEVLPATTKLASKYPKVVKDVGDVHLFTSAQQANCDYLVSLDKKHVLSLKTKVKKFIITSPAELIEKLSNFYTAH